MMNTTGKYCSVHGVAYVLVLVGALNWGLVGLGYFLGGKDLNVVHLLLGSKPLFEQIVYVLVGLSAVAMCFQSSCSYCKK